MIIYKATNNITGKCYIGQTINSLDKRIKGHLKESKGQNNRPFLMSLQKHGLDNFLFEIIDYANNLDELNDKEIYWINELNTVSPNGYNVTIGGQGIKTENYKLIGWLISEGLKKSEKWKKLREDQGYLDKITHNFYGFFKGKKFTDEHKKKIWEKNKERVLKYNKSTSKNWIIVNDENVIERISSKEEFSKEIGLDSGCMSRMSKRLKQGKKTKRYGGYYCFFNEGQSDKQILEIVNNLDVFFSLEYKITNRETKEVKILKKNEVYGFCSENEYNYSSFLRMLKGNFKSYKDWVL
jgi:group I intron endonuclease